MGRLIIIALFITKCAVLDSLPQFPNVPERCIICQIKSPLELIDICLQYSLSAFLSVIRCANPPVFIVFSTNVGYSYKIETLLFRYVVAFAHESSLCSRYGYITDIIRIQLAVNGPLTKQCVRGTLAIAVTLGTKIKVISISVGCIR